MVNLSTIEAGLRKAGLRFRVEFRPGPCATWHAQWWHDSYPNLPCWGAWGTTERIARQDAAESAQKGYAERMGANR